MHIQFSDNQPERQRVQQWLSLLRLQTQQNSLEEAIALAATALWLGQAGAIGDAIERADTGYMLPDSFCEALVAFAHSPGPTAVQQKAVTACDLLISHLKGV
jgi:hypothetical protein